MGEAGVVAGAFMAGRPDAVAGTETPLFPQLGDVGDKYSFAVIADPQVLTADTKNGIYQTTQRKLSMIVDEINKMSPMPAFVLVNGDLVGQVGVPKRGPEQIENFISRVVPLKPTTILVHGNHDGHEPWTEFKQMQKAVNGTEAVWFSWDIGKWHYIGIPAYLDTDESEKKFFDWLAQDLKTNKARPTMAFLHWHLMPGFRTQHEYYTFDKRVRTRLVELLTQHGNVRYTFSGHVHNGIKVTANTAWEYKGTKFITVPTCIAPRNFGEEFPEFAEGESEAPTTGDTGGGYYTIVDVDGDNAVARCRLVGVDKEYVLTEFRPYKDQEPLWFKNAPDLELNPKLVNGSFESGLKGWLMPCRYITDENPGFLVETTPNPSGGGAGAVVQVHETGQRWASTEVMELYQLVSVPSPGAVFEASYYLDALPKNGGGFIRLSLYSGSQLRAIMLFNWGGEDAVARMDHHTPWTVTGIRKNELEKNYESASWTTSAEPGKWHELRIDIGTGYDTLTGEKGSFSTLGIDRMFVGAGAWCSTSEPGSISRMRFDNLKFVASYKAAEDGILFDGDPLPVESEASKADSGNKVQGRKRSKSSKKR